jgi:deoxyribodipyrimidine photolyase-related protein
MAKHFVYASMESISLVFPHQLFKKHPALEKDRPVFLVEEWLFFGQYNFHKQKLILHRASMQFYKEWLRQKGFKVEYIDADNHLHDCRKLIKHLHGKGIQQIHYADVADDWLRKRLQTSAKKNDVRLIEYQSPNFLNTKESTDSFFSKRKNYFQTDFYVWQRKQRKILLDAADQPIGGKWSFDADNRSRFPKNEIIPVIDFPKQNKYVKEAREYAEKRYKNNIGLPAFNNSIFYPTTFEEAEKWLHDFLKQRFEKFGVYEDAMVKSEHFLYHSVLTPALNSGLLSPLQIIDETIAFAAKHKVPFNSLEGFVRQIIGWREFIHLVYEREGVKQRTTNYWGFKRKIPASFWNGTTGIEPIDTVIKKVLKTGYCHHIERLMVLGNFMLLCEFDPDEVYRWFMELFIDAYDWVMVPNVYGMTQFADGGLMTTKPYISGSNYLMKMGDWEKGEWQQTWDGLFWRFLNVHRHFFEKNPRLGMLVRTFDKMPSEKRNTHLNNAEKFLMQLGD